MADQITANPSAARDWAGDIVPGAKLWTYQTGTTSPVVVYQDTAGTIPHTNPVLADANGIWPQMFYTGALKVIGTDPDGVTLPGYPLDPAPRSLVGTSGAATISFTPTGPIPETNVQAAIERVQANQSTALENAGVAVTVAPLLANIDATAITSGRYRYDATTTGTFPSGVVVADTGVVVISAGASGNQVMQLTPRGGDRAFQRVMIALVWQTWDEVIVVSQAAVQGDIIKRGATVWERMNRGTKWQSLRMNDAATEPMWGGPGPNVETAIATTSGTAALFAGIPAGATRITIAFSGVSLSGTDQLLVQIGDAGGIEATGYEGGATLIDGAIGSSAESTGFVVLLGGASYGFHGTMTLIKVSGNTWVSSHSGYAFNIGGRLGGGSKTLSDVLTQIRIGATGADTFDAGLVTVAVG